MSLTAGTRLGPYEVVASLGAGGMGEVYQARDSRLGRDVAVKVVHPRLAADPERLSRFEKEARAAAQVDHPNILVVHDIGTHEGSPFIVSELLHGESLREKLGVPLSPKRAIDYAIQVAHGLAAAHEKGIVHRDIKPENVFVTRDGHVKILDFGIAKLLPAFEASGVDTRTPTEAATQPGTAIGTVAYMSPEQIRGQCVDARSDLFSLGVVLYEMLSGRRPFQRETAAETMTAILHEDPPSLAGATSTIPHALETIVIQCLEKQPADRLSSAHDLALALRTVSTDQQPTPKSVESPRPVHRPWRTAAVIVASVLAVVAVLGTTMILVRRTRPLVRAESEARTWPPARQITSAPGWEAEPAFSPDGTLVAYSAGASGNADIWIVDPDGGEPLRLTDGQGENRKPTWFPDSRSLAFVSTRSGAASVWKVSRLGGSASLLLENGDMPGISPDGARIVFTRPGPSGSPRIWVAPLADPSRAERLTRDKDGQWDHMDPAWSPDGTLVCYSDLHDLWLVPAGGGQARKLTNDGKFDREPAFSPDGRSVYFSSRRADPQSIWRAPLNGGAPERITPGTGTTNHPSLSRDGRLVFSTLEVDRDVVVADRKTGTVCRIASSRDDETPVIAADAGAVAYISNRLGNYDLWVEALQSGCPGTKPPRRLTNLKTSSAATPVFSPDGSRVAFFRVLGEQRDIWAVPVNGGTPVGLVESRAQNLHPAYAPDGKRLAFVSDRSGVEHVWIVSLLEGLPSGEPWRLTDGVMTDMFPVWSPDGGRIAFLRGEEAWVVEVRPGAAPRRVTAGAQAHHLAWEPGGTALLVSGLFGTPSLHLRVVDLASGSTKGLKPHLDLGDRDALGYISLSRDGRFVATDITKLKGSLWITAAPRDGR